MTRVSNWLQVNRQTLLRAAGSALALILLLILIKEESGAEILSALRRVSWGYFLAAIAALLVSRMFITARWLALLRSAGMEISFLRAAQLTFTGLFASNFLPTTIGGDVARLAGVMQLGYDRAVCLASLIADRLIGMAGMVFTLPFGLVPAWALLQAPAAQSAFLPPLYRKGVNFLQRTLEIFRVWLRRPQGLALALLATFANMAFIFLSIWFLILGMERHISYWLIAGLWSLTYFVTLVPVSINGFGVQELSLTFLLAELGGLTHAESLTIAILIRLLFIITSLPGAFFLPAILAAMNQAKVKPQP
ncbi:MAG: lysylphosphatidylglycerol synthase transmembrane domain-containing protein [Anaerolineales bacterium]